MHHQLALHKIHDHHIIVIVIVHVQSRGPTKNQKPTPSQCHRTIFITFIHYKPAIIVLDTLLLQNAAAIPPIHILTSLSLAIICLAIQFTNVFAYGLCVRVAWPQHKLQMTHIKKDARWLCFTFRSSLLYLHYVRSLNLNVQSVRYVYAYHVDMHDA